MKLAQITTINTPSNRFFTTGYATIIGDITGRILLYAIAFAGLYFFIRLVISGYNYMTALGDPAKIQSVHQQMINSGVGLLIVLTAFFIAQIAQYVLALNFL